MLSGSSGEFGMEEGQPSLHFADAVKLDNAAKIGGVIVPDAQLLFSGDFKRSGLDLDISHDDRHFLVRDYFKGENRATLLAPDGSSLSGQIVNSLTGHVDVAQAGARTSAATIIGTVVKLTGDATAVRNGVVIVLNIGDKVYKGDVVQSGSDSALGISFIDGTAFSLGASARMVLNDMVYDPNGSSNSSLLSLVQGTISFVAGETAKNGNMKIDTPVATMGIRGTAVVVEMTADNGPVKFSVVIEPGGHSGSAVLLNKLTGLEIATVNKPGQFTIVSSTGINQPLSILEVQKTANDLLNEREVVKLGFSIAFPQFNFDDANPKTKFAFGTSGNNLADDNLLPHPWGGEYPGLNSGAAGRLAGLTGELKFPDGPLFTNHEAPANATEGALVEDSVAQNQILATSGTLVFLDLDATAIQTTTFALAHSTTSVALPGFTNDVNQIGTFGVPNGGSAIVTGVDTKSTVVNWNFLLVDSDPVLQSLANGQTLTQVFTVTVTKQDGTELTQDVTVTMIGVNDTPILVSSTNDTLTRFEDSVALDQALSASGTIAFRDVDLIDTHTATVVLKSSTSSPHLPGYTDNISQIGSFALTSGPTGVSEIITDTDNTATVGWSFTLSDNDPVLQSLALGETLTQVYTVIITDNNGAQVTHDVAVTLVGTNDAPIITAQDLIGAVTEPVTPAGTLTDSGTIAFTDVDLTDVHLVSATGAPIGSVLGTLTAVKSSDTTGTGTGGQLTWTYTVADSAVEFLAAGQTKVESFTITLNDQNGGLITEQINVTITGSNDVPVIGGMNVGSVTEEVLVISGNISTSGALTIVDVDQGQSNFTAQAGTAGSNGYGSFTLAADGGWTYTASNTQTAIQQLGAGQSLTDSFTAFSSDGTASQFVTVTITGTNDVPVIGGVDIGSVTADVSVVSGHISTSGVLSIADVDQGQSNFTAQSGIVGSNGYGSFTLAANGSWFYTASNGQAAVQQLGAGQSLTDSFIAFSSDGTASHLVTVTILGTNNVPVIGGVSTGAVTEDNGADGIIAGNLTTGGTLTIADADQGQSSFAIQGNTPGSNGYGTFTLAANGSWTYTANNSQTAIQQLGATQWLTDSFTAVSSDGSASRVVTVTITGTNDAPIVAATDVSGTVTELGTAAGNLTDSGTIAFTDVDLTDVHSLSAVTASPGALGSLTASVTTDSSGSGLGGVVTWNYSVTAAAIEYLAAGQHKIETFSFNVLDGNGGSVSRTVSVDIVGTNDAPVVAATDVSGTVTELGTAAGNLTDSGTIAFTDVDLTDVHSLSAVTASPGALGSLTASVTTDSSGSGLGGVVTWNYSVTAAAIEYLAAGQHKIETFSFNVLDGHGGSVPRTISVDIVGTNDAPVVAATDVSGTVTELGTAAGNLTDSGIIAFTDVDLTDAHSVSAVTASPGALGSLTASVTTDSSGSGLGGVVTWNYSVSAAAIEYLAAGQHKIETFSFNVLDGNGGSVSRTVSVDIVGTNDAPVVAATDVSGTVTELGTAAGNLTDSGTIAFTDVDLTDVHSLSAVTASSGALGSLTASVTTDSSGSGLGGVVTWNYSVTVAAIEYLAAGQHKIETFSFNVLDGQGGSVSRTVTVTITGTNDAPIVAAVDVSGTVTELGTPVGNLTDSGTIAFTDVDLIDVHSLSAVTASPGALGSLTASVTTDSSGSGLGGVVTWNYSVTAAAIEYLAAGQHKIETFSFNVLDGQGGSVSRTVSVDIVGTNDAPVVAATDVSGTVTELGTAAGNLTDSGTIAFTDVDLSDAHSINAVTASAGALGNLTASVSTDSTGSGLGGVVTWNYSVAAAAVEYLAAGQHKIDTFSFNVLDGNGGSVSRTVSVDITGTNDAAVIGTPTVHDVSEDVAVSAGYLTAIGTISISDVDTGEDHFQTTVSGVAGNLGNLVLAADGSYTYSVLNSAAETVASTHVDTFTVRAADGTTKDVSFTIHGTNDAPIVQDGVQIKIANLSASGGQLLFSGGHFFGESDFTVSDPDGPQFGIAVTSLDNAHGIWEYQLAGTTTWTMINTLSSGQAFLLSAGDKIRFNGDASAPIETLGFKAWDGSDKSAHGTVITLPSELGGSSAFSTGTYFVATKNNGPAGVAGEPINLGLADPSLGPGYTATVTISDIPSDWVVNGGVHNLDGSWTVQTTNLASLSVTTPVSYSGAWLLNVTATVVLADGSIKTLNLGDNVEAYSPGSPIFAWSGDDFLTASSGDDLIVFSQPIGHDIVYSFDVAHDQIDLISYAGFATFADVQAHLAEDANGNAMITLSDGQSIVLEGVHAAALAETNFVFDQTPTLDNAGTMTISDGALMPLTGTIHNTGTIALSSTGHETDLQLTQYGMTLEGGGTILLSDSDLNVISGTGSNVTLDNEDNTISGAGSLGNGELSLLNAGTINATGTHALVIDTGSNVVANSGTLEASGSGGLIILSAVENSGFLWANGANLTIQGAVTGTGTATIDGTGILDFEASSTANVVFGTGTGGTLKLGDAFHFNGTITGFDGADVIDLENVDSGTASISYQGKAGGTGGTLTISDGLHVAELSLVGDYSADNFSLVPDQLKGTSITYLAHDLVV